MGRPAAYDRRVQARTLLVAGAWLACACRGTSPDKRVDDLKARLAEAEGRLESIERTGTKVDAQKVARELAGMGLSLIHI